MKLDELGSTEPLLVAFGREAYRVTDRFLAGRRRLVSVTHYSHQVSPGPYRAILLAKLDAASGPER